MRIYLSAEDPFDFDQILRIKPVLAIEPSLSRFDPDPLGSIKQTNYIWIRTFLSWIRIRIATNVNFSRGGKNS